MEEKRKSPAGETLVLDYPVTMGSEVVTELFFRRANGKDLSDAQKKGTDTETTYALIARLTGRTPAFVERMDLADITEAGKIIEGFSKHSRTTGDSGSESSHDI